MMELMVDCRGQGIVWGALFASITLLLFKDKKCLFSSLMVEAHGTIDVTVVIM